MAFTNTIQPQSARAPLARAIGAHVEGARDVVVFDVDIPPAAGMSNQTLFFTAAWAGEEHQLVARVHPPTDGGLFMTYDIDRELHLLTALRGTSIPVPRVWFAEKDSTLLGSPFIVMDRLRGRSPSDDPPFTAAGWLVDELDAESRLLLNERGLQMLAEIHAVKVEDVKFVNHGRDALGPLPQRVMYERRFYDWARAGKSYQLIERAFAWLDAHRPAKCGQPVLNWVDARISNFVFGPGLEIVGVVDWEMSCVGPRELDLGWWLFAMRHHTEGLGIPTPDGFHTETEFLARYAELTGYVPTDIRFYQVLAGVRGAIMMVRAASLMIGAGFLPSDTTMATVNPASIVLADLIGAPRPDGVATSYVGNRS